MDGESAVKRYSVDAKLFLRCLYENASLETYPFEKLLTWTEPKTLVVREMIPGRVEGS